jgi:hypothetical protein
MKSREQLLNQHFAKSAIGGTISINDLRDREFGGESLSNEERLALHNFDRYRLSELNAQTSDIKFHERYRQLQVMANLADWRDFLNLPA